MTKHTRRQRRKATPTTEPTPTPPAPPPICTFCGRVCVGVSSPAFAEAHWHDPDEVEKRDARATKNMMRNLAHNSRW